MLFAALLLAACGGQRQDEDEEAKQYDLLTITAGDHELTTEYAASLKGQQDIRIIPRIEGYLQGIYVKEGILLSGGTGKIVMPAVRKDAIVIPLEATYEIQDKVYVYKVVDGKTVSTIIEVEPQNNGKEYVVLSGLQEGDVIIAKGAGFVQEGERVIDR